MKISPLNFVSNSVINVKKDNVSYKNNLAITQDFKNDVFVKSNEVSFKSSEVKQDVGIALTAGTIFLAPLLIGLALATHQHPEDIFTYDGQYLGSVDKLYVNKQEAEKLGIDLNPERFKGPNCFADPINGIYKNEEKGIDIDLKAGKYIDMDKGIFVQPESQTSVIFTGGDAVPVILPSPTPSFSGASVINGPGVSSGPMRVKSSREEYVKTHDGKGPEEFDNAPWTYDKIEDIKTYADVNIITQALFEQMGVPIHNGYYHSDRRSIGEKFFDVLSFKCPKDDYIHDYWGRDIVTVNDALGKPHYVALSEDLAQRVHDEHISYETVQSFVSHCAEHPIQTYISENYLNELNNMHSLNPSMENFLDNLRDKHNDDSNIQHHQTSHDLDSSYNEVSSHDMSNYSDNTDNYDFSNSGDF